MGAALVARQCGNYQNTMFVCIDALRPIQHFSAMSGDIPVETFM